MQLIAQLAKSNIPYGLSVWADSVFSELFRNDFGFLVQIDYLQYWTSMELNGFWFLVKMRLW